MPHQCQNYGLLRFVSIPSSIQLLSELTHDSLSLFCRQLGASGNLQSTTKPTRTRQRREVIEFNSTRVNQVWSAMSPAEQRAAADDEDLASYFEAFPEQAEWNVNRFVSRFFSFLCFFLPSCALTLSRSLTG